MQIDVSRFRAAFYVEAIEHLQHMEAALLQLENAPRDIELLNTIFRAAHSIKGASTTFGIEEVGRFTHVLENLLERLRDGVLETTSELVELLLSSVDVIEGLISNAKDNAPLPANLETVFSELQRINATPESNNSHQVVSTSSNQPTRYRVTLSPSRSFFAFGQDPLLLLRELHDLGAVSHLRVDDRALPTLADLQPEDCYLAWSLELTTQYPKDAVHDVFMFLDEASSFTIDVSTDPSSPHSTQENASLAPLAPSPSPLANQSEETLASRSTVTSNSPLVAPPAVPVNSASDSVPSTTGSTKRTTENETVRVDRMRLDELINQIGELVIGASMVEQEMLSLNGGRSLDSMSVLGKIVRDLQEMSLGLRMVPIDATFQKMNRVIRDVAKKLKKQINFVTTGDDTELDKSVVDQISDPLVHMVRNAADHGIETPEERIAAGKPAEGVVSLRAYQQGGNIYIELKDDGKGLNRKRILEKAIERGIVDSSANLSDADICNLVFQPGFSTADAVTDVSGRGVGMDVVRRNVEALQGSVSIKSVEGSGSTIIVRLPLTLAILDGLLVRLSEEVFVIPLLSVIESICIRPSEIRSIVSVGEVITLRGEIVPLLQLHRLLNISSDSHHDDQVLLVIVEDQGRRLALRVDELIGQQQVVIKNLEANFRKVPGVAGATILGDGRVALILDVYGVSTLGSTDNSTPYRGKPLEI